MCFEQKAKVMETGINVQKSVQRLEVNKLVPTNNTNDGENCTQTEAHDSEKGAVTKVFKPTNTPENDIVSQKQCVNDLSVDHGGTDNATAFKKPTVVIGPKRSRSAHKGSNVSQTGPYSLENDGHCSDSYMKTQAQTEDAPFPYAEPDWGGMTKENYKMEILKSGVIIDTISLSERSFHVVGRLPSCHVSLAHPTISRYHAVLQYRYMEDMENPKGFYVYDLGSTHGTFWNGSRIKSHVYVRIQGGHMLRFGCSQRKYILQAPEYDHEEESQYSLTELKELRASDMEKRRINDEVKAASEDKETEGIDWGMGEDADEESDLQENPYASITDEDLILEDPKKTLRGWFEREGYDLHYQTEEKGLGQFLCWVDLPMEDIIGHSMRAEILVKGKKKEAVVQCALEACKILDKYGLLRQANHESRKRKARNWEAEDYYDSDEDNFLDRTGTVERKREHRMRLAGKLEEKVETYDTLLKKHEEIKKRISHLATSIENWQSVNAAKNEPTEEDALDAFMSSLTSFSLTKTDIAKMKLELQSLRKEEAGLIKLLNLTRPANLPNLSFNDIKDQTVHRTGLSQVMQEVSSKAQKAVSTKFCRKKEKQLKHRLDVNTSAERTAEADPEEEMDSEEDDESSSNSSHGSVQRDGFESRRSVESAFAVNKKVPIEINDKQRKQKVPLTKKRRQTERKVYCDQDVQSGNYSTWVPPQDQAGDGKTSLNEKYGY